MRRACVASSLGRQPMPMPLYSSRPAALMRGPPAKQLAALESASGPEASTLFLELMIEHHQGAITMAEDVIANGQSAQVRDLAEQIITSQTAEIDTMNELLSR